MPFNFELLFRKQKHAIMKINLLLSLGFTCLFLNSLLSQNSDVIELQFGHQIKGSILNFGVYRVTILQVDSTGRTQVLKLPYQRIKSIDSKAYDTKGRTLQEINDKKESNKRMSLGLSMNGVAGTASTIHKTLGINAQFALSNTDYMSMNVGIGKAITSPDYRVKNGTTYYYLNDGYIGGPGFIGTLDNRLTTNTRTTLDLGFKIYGIPAHSIFRPYALFMVGLNHFRHNVYYVQDSYKKTDTDGRAIYESRITTNVKNSLRFSYGLGLGFEVNLKESITLFTQLSLSTLNTNQILNYRYLRFDKNSNLEATVENIQGSDITVSLLQGGISYRLKPCQKETKQKL